MNDGRFDLDRLRRGSAVAAIEVHETLGSTNDRAREWALEAPELTEALVLTEMQTAGRGRGANRWWSGEGAVAFSVLFSPTAYAVARPQWPLVSLAAGIAVVEAISPLAPGVPLGLHWPNDVFVAERKLAGILVETTSDGRHIVGIGVNVNNRFDAAPPEVARRATSLVELRQRSSDRTAIVVDAVLGFRQQLERLARDPALVGRRANELCLQRGEILRVVCGPETHEGRCLEIADDGGLVLDCPDQRRRIYSGVLQHQHPEPGPQRRS